MASSSALATLALTGPALAQAPQPPAATTPVAPEPARGTLALKLERVRGDPRFVIAGKRWRVRGLVSTFVPGQRVTVRLYLGRHRIRSVTVAILPGADGTGRFVLGFATRRSGRYTVSASHRRTPQLDTLVAPAQQLTVVSPRIRPGARGASVRVLQAHLARRRYAVSRSGVFDARTARAVLTFRKVTGMARTTEVGARVFEKLGRGAGAFRVRYRSHGRHIEADLSRQVLALIEAGGRVHRIHQTSSGAPATPTILGSFRVYRKDPGTNSLGMYMSSYFIRGYAVHGYPSVPPYPASHGCLRIPNADAVGVYRWIRYGTRVDVYP
jgi:peptidoglycan hydrolase-like protein with peptidoglycan-binding domain